VCVLVGVCACVWVRVCGCTGAGLCLRAFNFTNPACNAQPYCHLWPLCLYCIFRRSVINCTIFVKTLLSINCVFLISVQILFEIFLTLRSIQRGVVINIKTSSCKVPVILVGF
jgi:hypothetical protein